MIMSKNILKKKKIRKDYERRRNIMSAEKEQIEKRMRKGFKPMGYSIDLPKSRK